MTPPTVGSLVALCPRGHLRCEFSDNCIIDSSYEVLYIVGIGNSKLLVTSTSRDMYKNCIFNARESLLEYQLSCLC